MSSEPADDDYGISAAEVDDRRREDLLDHRQKVRERWLHIRSEQLDSRTSVRGSEAREAAYEVAEWFIADLAPLMRPEIGSEPPTRVDWWNREVGDFPLPDGENKFVVEDLQDFMDLDMPYTYSWEVEVDDGIRGTVTKERSQKVYVPMEISKKAIRMGEHFLADLGLEVDVTNANDRNDISEW